jgi:hypothetical protein
MMLLIFGWLCIGAGLVYLIVVRNWIFDEPIIVLPGLIAFVYAALCFLVHRYVDHSSRAWS